MENWCFFTSCQDQLVFSIALGPFGEADPAISFGDNPAVCPLWLRRSVDGGPAPRVSKGKHRRARSWADLRHALPVLRSWQAVFGAICSTSERWFSALDHSVIKDSIVFMFISSLFWSFWFSYNNPRDKAPTRQQDIWIGFLPSHYFYKDCKKSEIFTIHPSFSHFSKHIFGKDIPFILEASTINMEVTLQAPSAQSQENGDYLKWDYWLPVCQCCNQFFNINQQAYKGIPLERPEGLLVRPL